MSCRVLNRKVEEATLNELVCRARQAGVGKLWGEYRPTGRNRLVEDHYRKLGFSSVATNSAAQQWVLDLENYAPPPVPINIPSSRNV
jgi:predicted enzyme involved in methoxymalonyl-ACP biosynthesis